MRKVAWFVLVLAGCTQAPDVTVSLYQTRSDTPLDKIEMQVQNNEGEPLTVQKAQLLSTALSDSPVWTEPVTIPPGAAVDLKVQLPPALCAGDAVNEVTLTIDGSDRTFPAEDRLGQLAKYRVSQCFRQQVDDQGGFRIIGLNGDRLKFESLLHVASIGSTTLFIPRDLQASSVQLTPNRCDAHALAEDKQGTYFPVELRLPDGQRGDYRAGVSPGLRSQLYALYARQCGL